MDVLFWNETHRLFVLMDVSIQMQISSYPDFNTRHHVVHSLQTSTSFKSLPTSLSYDFGIRRVAPKLFFPFTANAFNRTESMWAGMFFFLAAVVGCLWGVCWIMEGISVGFLWNKDCFFLTTVSCYVNQSQSLQTWRTHKWCLHSFFNIRHLRL